MIDLRTPLRDQILRHFRTFLSDTVWHQTVLFLLLGLTTAQAQPVVATDEARPSVTAARFESAPVIDGKLDDPQWRDAAVLGELKQIRPGNGQPVSEPTEILIAFDKDALYIGARMADRRGPAAISATTMRQGSRLPDDDRLAIILDPAGTGRGAYRFEVNLNSVRNDALYQNGQFANEWTAIWEAKATLTDEGWSAEMAIPFKTLPNDPNVEAWGLNVSRAIRGKGEEALWVSRNRSFGPSITGALKGINQVDQGRGLDIVPTLGLRELRFFGAGDDRQEVKPSLDAYYRLTPQLSASLTINTDFSGTDTDDRQVNLTRFSLFFPEKRDFFLKDADLFDFGNIERNGRPFFSRKIGLSPAGTPIDIDYGGKLSGRSGRWRVGLMTVRQDEFSAPPTTPAGIGLFLQPSTLAVARVSADVLQESSVGMIATYGDPFSDASASLLGFDFRYLNSRFSGNRTLDGEAWLQQSNTAGASDDASAFGLGARLIDNDGWQFGASLSRLDENFRPAMGFVSRTGVQEVTGLLGFRRVYRQPFLQQITSTIELERVETLSGQLESQTIEIHPAEIETTKRDLIIPFFNLNTEQLADPFLIYRDSRRNVVIPPGRYSFNNYGVFFRPGQQRKYSMRFTLQGGDFYDGSRQGASAELIIKPSKYWNFALAYDFNDIELSAGQFTTRILSTAFNFNFNSALTWATRLQYDNVSEVAGLQSHLYYVPRAGQQLQVTINHNSQDRDQDGNFRSLAAEYGARLSYTFRF